MKYRIQAERQINSVTLTEIASRSAGVEKSMMTSKLKSGAMSSLILSCLTLVGGTGLLAIATRGQSANVVSAQTAERGKAEGTSAAEEKHGPKIAQLQQEHLKLLESILESTSTLYQRGRIEFIEVVSAERELLSARLAYAGGLQERLETCDEFIKHAEQWADFAKAKKESARGTELSVLKAKALILEVQLIREQLHERM